MMVYHWLPASPLPPPPPPCIFRNFEWKVAVADFAFYRKKKIIKSRFLEGHLNTILAPWGGHLNEPIFNSSNAPGLPRGMLELRMDRHVTSWVKRQCFIINCPCCFSTRGWCVKTHTARPAAIQNDALADWVLYVTAWAISGYGGILGRKKERKD